MSTFYSDGYQDALDCKKPSPPDLYDRNDGLSTDVFAKEYMEGYNAAIRAMVNFHEVYESIKSDRDAGNEQ